MTLLRYLLKVILVGTSSIQLQVERISALAFGSRYLCSQLIPRFYKSQCFCLEASDAPSASSDLSPNHCECGDGTVPAYLQHCNGLTVWVGGTAGGRIGKVDALNQNKSPKQARSIPETLRSDPDTV